MRSLFTPTLPLRRDVLAAAAGSLLAMTAGGAEPVAPYLNGAFPEAAPGGSGSWTTANAFPNLAFHDPVFVTQAPRGGKMFVVGKDGRIWSFDHDPEAAAKTLVLDLRASVQVTDNAGMGGIAFHPEFGDPASPNRGYFYLHYYYSPAPVPFAQTNDEAANPAYWRLVRFTIADGSETADPASEFVLIHQYDRHHWHNGGSLFFDNAGLLYATNGDAGGDYDSYADSQKLGEALFGGMLRIDVDMDLSRGHPIRRQPQVPGRPAGESYTQGYTIPDDNPWLDAGGAILEEFWCIGLRSPHRASYDPATGRIWVGDVGQERREEVNFIVKGGNYQWPYRDGTLTGYRAKPSPLIGTDQPPAFDYPRATGVCVIGGYVYRGREHASALNGRYLFADHEFRHIWAMDYTPGQVPAVEFLTDMPPGGFHANVSSFGTDNGGELYICKLEGRSRDDGKILKLARTGVTVPEPPNLLSQTGAFTDLATMQPAPGVTPYHLNHPFWSDGAVKSRFIAVPNDGTHDAPGERIGFSADGNWAFPAGTVFIKHFDLPGFGKLETRFLVRAADGSFYGVTYRWRADQSDADLLYGAEDADVPLAGGGSQAWAFPSRSDCMVCHTAARGYALGVRTAQLNRDFYNPLTARIENQIAAWSSRGVFDPAPGSGSGSDLPKLAHLGDAAAPLDHRIRSWLDANCAACHHPGGAQASFDARFSTPLADQGLINGAVQKTFGIAGAKVVAPGDLSRSILHHRFSSLDPDRMMPPLAKNVAHAEAVALVERWIGSRDASHYPGAGMTAQFFSDANLGDYALTRIDPVIDANWGAGAPDAALPADGWSVRWVGDLTPLISPTYTFYAAVDGGVRLWIGGDLKIDQWEHEGPGEFTAAAAVTAGQPTALRFEYRDRSGDARAALLVSAAGVPKQVLPAVLLSHPGRPAAEDDEILAPAGAAASLSPAQNDSDWEGDLAPGSLRLLDGGASADGGGSVAVPASAADAVIRYQIGDARALVSDPAEIRVRRIATAADWRAFHFPYEIDFPAVAAWSADHDNDGRPNAVEAALGSDPLKADAASWAQPEIAEAGGQRFLQITVPKPQLSGIACTAEASGDLSDWSSDVDIIAESATHLTARDKVPLAPGSPRHFRLRIVIASP